MVETNDNKSRGYIKLYRMIDQWEWYTEINVFKLFCHCLIKANHTNKSWRGINIQHGSFITSVGKLAEETGLSIQQVRTAIKKLNSTKEITCKSHSQYTVITVNKWSEYQPEQQTNEQLNHNQSTNNQQSINNNEECSRMDNNEKEYFFNLNPKKTIYDPIFSPEIKKFLSEFKKQTHKPTAINPEERICLMNTLNDLVEQGYEFAEIIKIICRNFNAIDFDLCSFTPSINWLLKNNAEQFYATFNGQYNRKLSKQDIYIQEAEEREAQEREMKGWN